MQLTAHIGIGIKLRLFIPGLPHIRCQHSVIQQQCDLLCKHASVRWRHHKAGNIRNQICRCINSTGHFYEDDIAELKARLGDVWELLKMRQKEEL